MNKKTQKAVTIAIAIVGILGILVSIILPALANY